MHTGKTIINNKEYLNKSFFSFFFFYGPILFSTLFFYHLLNRVYLIELMPPYVYLTRTGQDNNTNTITHELESPRPYT